MSMHSIFLATRLLGLSLLIVPRAASGQVPASDSTTPATSDSQPPLTDSLQQTRADSASGADSTRATSDTVRPPSAGTATRSDTATAPTTPGDSLLSAACRGPAGPATVARNLLVVVFVPEAGGAERAAAAKSIGGTLLGRVTSGEASTYYLRVPSGGEEYRLRVAADQLIQLDMVRQVGSRACPPLPQ